ncbi:hypothetical protein SAMN06269117_12525 [Balnearium lithotrophicum]|uniref:Uncharacterized protein n=1 Tax=Balnearium lithotrophicum TaxID=223788 RepID=A0A521DT56_9BACT|nr:hypothetical protein [Balnearium lithotrophicum]SMO74899.1 hypothetical protein SAMN06269117_12525 [Balnearium lithotrophicum]
MNGEFVSVRRKIAKRILKLAEEIAERVEDSPNLEDEIFCEMMSNICALRSLGVLERLLMMFEEELKNELVTGLSEQLDCIQEKEGK